MIELDKILPGISAEEYCKSAGTKLEDYEIRGLQIYGRFNDIREICLKRVPENTEAVIGYRVYSSNLSSESLVVGTALIRKEKSVSRE